MTEDLSFRQDELPEDRSLVIVDDDKAFLQRLLRAMEGRGFDVRAAASVQEGLDLIRQLAPAFAVVDMRLEDGNGLDVLAELGRLRPNARAIILTGYGNIATAVTAVSLVPLITWPSLQTPMKLRTRCLHRPTQRRHRRRTPCRRTGCVGSISNAFMSCATATFRKQHGV